MWSKSPDDARLVDSFQEKEAAGLKRLVDLLEDGQVIIFVLEIAKGCEYVDNGVKLVFEGKRSHIPLNPACLNSLRFSLFLCPPEKRLAEVQSCYLIALLS